MLLIESPASGGGPADCLKGESTYPEVITGQIL